MPQLTDLMRTHELLRRDFQEQREAVRADPSLFVGRIATFFNEAKRVSATVTSRDDYEWLRSAVESWRSAFITTLGYKPLDVELESPLGLLSVPSQPAQYSAEWFKKEIAALASGLAKSRVINRLKAESPDEVLRRIASTPKEEKDDWYNAISHLAAKVFSRDLELSQLRAESYYHLEGCWLEDVKRMQAYYIWWDGGDGFKTEPGRLSDYQALTIVSATHDFTLATPGVSAWNCSDNAVSK